MSFQRADSEVIRAIYERRSVRNFTEAPVERRLILEILRTASWAPSGLNNQPWRFAMVWDQGLKEELARLTRYAAVLKNAAVLVPVFLDKESSYDYVKDCQAIGACLQNLLLASHGMGLGAVWLGEILKSAKEVRELCGLSNDMELMAVVALGHHTGKGGKADRRPVEEVLLKEL